MRSEYTLQSGSDGLGDIMIAFPKILPNLRVSDTDGTGYAVMPNEYVNAMLSKNGGGAAGRSDAGQILGDIRSDKKFLVWIKIPPAKQMKTDEVRILYFDYDSEKDDVRLPSRFTLGRKRIFLNVTPVEFPVFWILKKPEGYDLGDIKYYEANARGRLTSSKLSENPNAHMQHTAESDSFQVKKPSEYVAVSYIFSPKRSLVALPFIFGVFLALLSSILAADLLIAMSTVNAAASKSLLTGEKFTLAIFILASAMVIPRLNPHVEIRHGYRCWYAMLFVPVAIYLASSIALSW